MREVNPDSSTRREMEVVSFLRALALQDARVTLPIESLSHVALLTRNRARAISFYRDFLGFSVVYETSRSVMLRWGDPENSAACSVVIFEPEDQALPEKPAGLVDHLGFRVAGRKEVDACASAARSAGYRVDGPIDDQYVGYFCLVWDPDGNRLEFAAPEGVNRF